MITFMGQSDLSSMRPFRADDWWRSKASLLMGFVYLFTLWFDIPIRRFIPLSFLSLIVIIGFASFGYLINDFFDKEKDRQSGKKNFLHGKSMVSQFGLLALTLIFIVFPWLYLPADTYSYVGIGLQLTLLLIYSVPPVRLKEKGVIGLIVDALYAHAVPVLLAAYTFLLASGHKFPWIGLLFLFLWQFMNGMRNIFLHQFEDIDADSHSQTKNYVASVSEKARYRFLSLSMVLELAFCLLFFLIASLETKEMISCLLLVLAFCILAFFRFGSYIDVMLHSTWRYFPNSVYEKWLPALYLIILSFHTFYFILFLIAHVALFNVDFYSNTAKSTALFFRLLYPRIVTPIVTPISLIVNYLIYYGLLLFGIDLKKENTSAFKYFKSRLKKK